MHKYQVRWIQLICFSTANLFAANNLAQEPSGNSSATEKQPTYEGRDLIDAARNGDLEKTKAILAAGVDVNWANEYRATALLFACETGNVELVKTLIDAGANPNVKDSFYGFTPMSKAGRNIDIVALLISGGLEGVDTLLIEAVLAKNYDRAKVAIENGKLSPEVLSKAKYLAKQQNADEIIQLFGDQTLPEFVAYKADPEALKKYLGKFAGSGITADVVADQEQLVINYSSGGKSKAQPLSATEFVSSRSVIAFELDDDRVSAMTISYLGSPTVLKRVEANVAASDMEKNADEGDAEAADELKSKFGPSSKASLDLDRKISSSNWPGFRGYEARGVAEGQNPPTKWNVDENENLKWRTEIPGLGNSCPVIWDDRIFVTTAVSAENSGQLKIGLYGNVDSVQEDAIYKFKIYCIDKNTGEILWDQTAHESKPAIKRHAKSSHANPTPATDGTHVVAFFGSEGLYCYSVGGELVWQQDFGILDSGWFYDAGYQWGFGASPTIYNDMVIVQCDIQKGSFVAALDLKSGEEIWRTERNEIPCWSSPIVHEFGDQPMLITQGTRAARGYNARTGEELWSLPNQSEIAVPTPFVAHDLIYIASGYRPIRPVYAIRPTAHGDIALPEKAKSSEYIAWNLPQAGPYMPTPIVYGDYLYICTNDGILTCHDAATGDTVYKKRLRASGGGLSFTASPVAGDGHIYFSSEDGRRTGHQIWA